MRSRGRCRFCTIKTLVSELDLKSVHILHFFDSVLVQTSVNPRRLQHSLRSSRRT